jgi:hypothetical protein
MRVLFSDLPPEFPEDPTAENDESFEVTDEDDNLIDRNGNPELLPNDTPNPAFVAANKVVGDFELGLNRLMELLKEARESEDGFAGLFADDEDVTFQATNSSGNLEEISDPAEYDKVSDAGGAIWLSIGDLEELIKDLEKDAPPLEQIRPNNGSGNIISKLIYNTVTTFYVGEKVMIEMPTWNFPGGGGAWSLGAHTISHGEPSPLATFRFAEPIYIDRQQNFRVEMEVPDADVLKEIQKIYGPLFIWVVLDGYMTRGVQ